MPDADDNYKAKVKTQDLNGYYSKRKTLLASFSYSRGGNTCQ